jgi:hypothetical protein
MNGQRFGVLFSAGCDCGLFFAIGTENDDATALRLGIVYRVPQGSVCGATLGFGPKSLWDFRCELSRSNRGGVVKSG